jgi:regulator of sigma E protease
MIAFFVVIGPLIFIHELGHFVVAKLNGIHVEEFGIGFPPRLFTLFERGGTRYTINAIPMGGFVRPIGEDDPTIEGGLAGAPKRARLAMLSAGPGANIVAAYVVLVVTFMLGWQELLPGASIEEVQPDTPAEEAGLMVGDIVVYADDEFIDQPLTLIEYVNDRKGEPVTLQVDRGGDTVDVTLTPREEYPSDQGPTGITISGMVAFRKYGFGEAIVGAADELVVMTRLSVEIPVLLIRECLSPVATIEDACRFLRPASVVGISQIGGQVIEESLYVGQWFPILRLASFVSLALAFTNLLPIPALDGGRIAFVLVEAVRGRRIDPEREGLVHFVGLAALFTLMLFLMFLDVIDLPRRH